MKTILLAVLVCVLHAPLQGETMRSVNFRDNVLWAIAEKDGLDPTTDLLNDIAREYVSSINAWLRRLYDVADFAEWTDIQAFTPGPTTHLISWDAVPGVLSTEDQLDPPKIGKVLKVYLLDPRTTWTPVDTPFRETKQGIYVGFDHGPTVWLKFIPRVPVFTSEVWDSSRTYRKDEITYSPTVGECYKSKVNGNRNHDPASVPRPSPPHLGVEEIQPLQPADMGTEAAPQITDVVVQNPLNNLPVPDPMPNGDEFTLVVSDTSGTPLSAHSIMGDGVTSIAAMLAALKVQCDGDALPGFTFTVFGADKKLRIQSTTTEFVIQSWQYSPAPNTTWFPLVRQQIQPLLAGTPATDIVPQQVKLTMGDGEFIPGALYSLTFTDNDGTEHSVEYQSNVFDNRNQIFNGLALAMGASTDLVIANASASINTSEPSMTISIIRQIGIDAPVRPPGNQYWTLIPFPFALVDQVVRGVYADVLKTEGQADKGMAEEQSVPQETQLRIGAGMATGTDMITDQQTARGRYAR